jgi:hypothetical protein
MADRARASFVSLDLLSTMSGHPIAEYALLSDCHSAALVRSVPLQSRRRTATKFASPTSCWKEHPRDET